MARDPSPVRINVTSTANTDGLEKAKEATDQVTEATEKLTQAEKDRAQQSTDTAAKGFQLPETSADQEAALNRQRDADLERAQNLKKIREEAQEANEHFDKLFDQQRLLANVQQFRQLAIEAGNFARAFAETEKGQEMLSELPEGLKVFGEQFAKLGQEIAAGYKEGGVWGAAIGAAKGLITTIGAEVVEANKRIEQSNRELEQALEAHRIKLEERKRAASDKAIVDAYDAELKRLKEQTAELERIRGIRDALAGLAAAKDAQADSRSARSGVPQAAIDIENIGQGLEQDQGALAQQLADEKQKLTILLHEAQAAVKAWGDATKGLSDNMAEKTAEFERVKEVQARLVEATKNFDALQQQLGIRMETLTVNATTNAEEAIARAETEISADVRAQAQQAIDLIEGIKTQAGGELSRKATDVLQELYRIISDNIPDAKQADALANQMLAFRDSNEGMNRQTYAAVTQMMESFKGWEARYKVILDGFRAVEGRFQDMDSDLNGIRARMETARGHR